MVKGYFLVFPDYVKANFLKKGNENKNLLNEELFRYSAINALYA